MSRVVINTVEQSPEVQFPALNGVSAEGTVKTRSVIPPGRPLLLWAHELAPGAELRWQNPKFGHVLYIWKGGVEVDSSPMSEESTVVVEHRANARVKAGPQGATLLHYHQSEDAAPLTQKAGGNVHRVSKEGLFGTRDEVRNCTNTVWADAHCPTCDLWLHRSAFGTPRPQSEPHMHNEDEIIFVVQGGTIVGKTHPPGTAIAVDAETIYGFGVAEGGTAFTNFRPCNPMVKMTKGGKPTTDWISEWEFMQNKAEIAFNKGGA
jgi:hypothetical protein